MTRTNPKAPNSPVEDQDLIVTPKNGRFSDRYSSPDRAPSAIDREEENDGPQREMSPTRPLKVADLPEEQEAEDEDQVAGDADTEVPSSAPRSVHSAERSKSNKSSKSSKSDPKKQVIKPDKLINSVLGSYRLLSLIGSGGMGRVYLAEHTKLGRRVALKLLRPEYAEKKDAVQRFFQEARAVNKIGHENIVDITDLVELPDGQTFFIMEFLSGEDLSTIQRMSAQPMSTDRALRIALQVCDALEAVHKVGIIHRDLKPDNIYIVNNPTKKDFVKLLDFGVAKLTGSEHGPDILQTAAGAVVGTPAYMSPEQAAGMPIDHRSDIYSFGAILYELFTGQPVFRAKSFGEYVIKHMNEIPIPPRDIPVSANLLPDLERLVIRCLEKDPNRRFQSARALHDELVRCQQAVSMDVQVAAAQYRQSKINQRRMMLFPILGGIILLGIIAMWITANINTGPTEREPSISTARNLPGNQPSTMPEPVATDLSDNANEGQVRISTLKLITEPAGAKVYRKDRPQELLGTTPLELKMTNIGEEVEFIFRLPGYVTTEHKELLGNNISKVIIPLERAAQPSPGGAAAKSPGRYFKERKSKSKSRPDKIKADELIE